MKFIPGVPVLPKKLGTRDYPTKRSAAESPLALKLFQNEGVERVFLGDDFITVTKSADADWKYLRTLIINDIFEFFMSGEKVILEEKPASETTKASTEDDEVVAMIKELLDTRIRPSVQDDGGDVIYMGYVEGVVFLKMQGSCHSCPSSTRTLQGGIERMLKHWIPEVQGVVGIEEEEMFVKLVADKLDNADAVAKENYNRIMKNISSKTTAKELQS